MTLADKLQQMIDWARANEKAYWPEGVHVQAIESLWPWIEQVGAKSVLDCACGERPGPLGKLLEEKGVASTGIDLLGAAEVQGDVHDLPFEDESFDLVLSREGPEHFLIPYLGIAEMIRVSRGWLILCLPADKPRCEESPGHLYVMGKQGWENVYRRLRLTIENFSEFDITDNEKRPQTEWRWLLRKER